MDTPRKKLLFCFDSSSDDENTLNSIRDFFWNQGFDVAIVTTARESWQVIKEKGGQFHGIALHKDLGDYSTNEPNDKINCTKIINYCHENFPSMLTLVQSGEYPNGAKDIKEMRADAYCAVDDLSDFTLKFFQKEPLTINEQEMRLELDFIPDLPENEHRILFLENRILGAEGNRILKPGTNSNSEREGE
jgi:hypothetical protein